MTRDSPATGVALPTLYNADNPPTKVNPLTPVGSKRLKVLEDEIKLIRSHTLKRQAVDVVADSQSRGAVKCPKIEAGQKEIRRQSLQRLHTVDYMKQSQTVKNLVKKVMDLSSAVKDIRGNISQISGRLGKRPVSLDTLPDILKAVLDHRFEKEKKHQIEAFDALLSNEAARSTNRTVHVETEVRRLKEQLKKTELRVRQNELQLGGGFQTEVSYNDALQFEPNDDISSRCDERGDKNVNAIDINGNSDVVPVSELRHTSSTTKALPHEFNKDLKNKISKDIKSQVEQASSDIKREIVSQMKDHVETSVNVIHRSLELLSRQTTETKLLCDRLTARSAETNTSGTVKKLRAVDKSPPATWKEEGNDTLFKPDISVSPVLKEIVSKIENSSTEIASMRSDFIRFEKRMSEFESNQRSMQKQYDLIQKILEERKSIDPIDDTELRCIPSLPNSEKHIDPKLQESAHAKSEPNLRETKAQSPLSGGLSTLDRANDVSDTVLHASSNLASVSTPTLDLFATQSSCSSSSKSLNAEAVLKPKKTDLKNMTKSMDLDKESHSLPLSSQLLKIALKERSIVLRDSHKKEADVAMARQAYIEVSRLWKELSERLRILESDIQLVKTRQLESNDRINMASRRAIHIAKTARNASMESRERTNENKNMLQDILCLKEKIEAFMGEHGGEGRRRNVKKHSKALKVKTRRKKEKTKSSLKSVDPEPWNHMPGTNVDFDIDVTSFAERDIDLNLRNIMT